MKSTARVWKSLFNDQIVLLYGVALCMLFHRVSHFWASRWCAFLLQLCCDLSPKYSPTTGLLVRKPPRVGPKIHEQAVLYM